MPMFLDRLKVFFGCIPFVAGEVIFRVFPMTGSHDPIAGYLGHNRSRGDGQAFLVALDYGLLGNWQVQSEEAVDQEKIGVAGQGGYGFFHGLQGSPMDVQLIDLLRLHNPEADGRNFFLKKGKSLLPLFTGKSLGVVDSRKPDPERQNDGRGHDRTGQRTPSRFIQSGHEPKPFGADFPFKRLHASLRSIRKSPSA